jgi:RNA polymerase sigma factor (sigma-70 family)
LTVKEYNECVDSYADRLFRFALKSLRKEDQAKDIVQDCFERLWMKRETIDPAGAKSYLFTAAYHAMVDFWRKDRKHGNLEEIEETKEFEPVLYSGLKPLLQKALDRLPPVQKSVLLLRDYEGYDYREIGTMCGLSESQVKVYIYRARLSMKTFLGSLNAVLG